MDNTVKLIEAIAKLLGAIAWPLVVGLLGWYVLAKHKSAVAGILERMQSVVLPGGVEMQLYEKVEEQEQQVIEAAARVAEAAPGDREPAIERLVTATERSDELRRLVRVVMDKNEASERRQEALDELVDKHKIRLFRRVLDSPKGYTSIRSIEEFDQDPRNMARLNAAVRRS